MTEEIKEILKLHKLWLDNDPQGRRANLCNADLRNADLCGADLRVADLRAANLCAANLCAADLRNADLRAADLRAANLRAANLDYSCLPLWCGGFDINIDDRIAVQILYHLVRNVIGSINTSPEIKTLLSSNEIIAAANRFHKSEECGSLDIRSQEE